VVRLYHKNEMSYATSGQTKYYDKIRQQYDYARDNIDSLKRSAGLDVTSKGANEDFTNIFIAKFFEFVKRVIYLFAAFLVFTMIFKNVSFLKS
jgi:hypothetical protein